MTFAYISPSGLKCQSKLWPLGAARASESRVLPRPPWLRRLMPAQPSCRPTVPGPTTKAITATWTQAPCQNDCSKDIGSSLRLATTAKPIKKD